MAGTGVGVASVEREATLALGVRDLAHVGALVPEVLIPRTSLLRLERLGAFNEDTGTSGVALVVVLAVEG